MKAQFFNLPMNQGHDVLHLEHAHGAAGMFLVCSILIRVLNYFGTNKKCSRVPVQACSTLPMIHV